MHSLSIFMYDAVEIFSRLSICFIVFFSSFVSYSKSTIKTMPMVQRRLKTKQQRHVKTNFSNEDNTHTRARSTQRSNLIPKLCADCDQVDFSVISIRFFLSVVVSLHTLFSTAFCLLTRQMWMCIVALRYNVKLDCQMIRSFLHQRKGEEKTKQSKTNQIYMKNKRTILVGWTDRWSDWQGVPTNTPGVIMQKSRQWWLLLFVQQQQKMSQEKTHKKTVIDF